MISAHRTSPTRARRLVGGVAALLAVAAITLSITCGAALAQNSVHDIYIRIYDWKTGELYAEMPARAGGELFFGWIHSWEHIPWNEYYRIEGDLSLTLRAITFPAFGAGIPENKGKVCYIDEDGLIHMEEIDQRFDELVWLNSAAATRDIAVDGELLASGKTLPHHVRLRLAVESEGDEDGSDR